MLKSFPFLKQVSPCITIQLYGPLATPHLRYLSKPTQWDNRSTFYSILVRMTTKWLHFLYLTLTRCHSSCPLWLIQEFHSNLRLFWWVTTWVFTIWLQFWKWQTAFYSGCYWRLRKYLCNQQWAQRIQEVINDKLFYVRDCRQVRFKA